MLRHEMEKMIKNKRFVIIFTLIFLLTIPDLISNWYMVLYPPHFMGYSEVTHPCKASFLSNNSIGHIPQMILEWLMPIIFLILGCDSATREKRLNCRNIYISANGRHKYYFAKIFASFVIPFSMILFILILNWIICLIVFRGGITFASLETQITQSDSPFLYYQFQHPFFIYSIYIVIFSFISGVCGVMCQGLSILFADSKKTYFTSFIIWIFQFSTVPYLPNAIQPFTETSLLQTVLGILRCIGISIIVLIFVWIRKRKKPDEI